MHRSVVSLVAPWFPRATKLEVEAGEVQLWEARRRPDRGLKIDPGHLHKRRHG
jgi:hypothetical protein